MNVHCSCKTEGVALCNVTQELEMNLNQIKLAIARKSTGKIAWRNR